MKKDGSSKTVRAYRLGLSLNNTLFARKDVELYYDHQRGLD